MGHTCGTLLGSGVGQEPISNQAVEHLLTGITKN